MAVRLDNKLGDTASLATTLPMDSKRRSGTNLVSLAGKDQPLGTAVSAAAQPAPRRGTGGADAASLMKSSLEARRPGSATALPPIALPPEKPAGIVAAATRQPSAVGAPADGRSRTGMAAAALASNTLSPGAGSAAGSAARPAAGSSGLSPTSPLNSDDLTTQLLRVASVGQGSLGGGLSSALPTATPSAEWSREAYSTGSAVFGAGVPEVAAPAKYDNVLSLLDAQRFKSVVRGRLVLIGARAVGSLLGVRCSLWRRLSGWTCSV